MFESALLFETNFGYSFKKLFLGICVIVDNPYLLNVRDLYCLFISL